MACGATVFIWFNRRLNESLFVNYDNVGARPDKQQNISEFTRTNDGFADADRARRNLKKLRGLTGSPEVLRRRTKPLLCECERRQRAETGPVPDIG
jgi:predicted DNA-binding WGR domain protein